MTFALRGYGPRIFISYSFRDAGIAQTIDQELTKRGFQVRREDEMSLADQKLVEAIPRRIAEAEVLVQILTATSNASAWVAREFAYATARRDQAHDLVILPIVFTKASLPQAVSDWWFLDLENAELTSDVFDHIERIALRSVHLLPLNPDDPMALRAAEARDFLERIRDGEKRVIVDSEGCLLRWCQETLDYCATVDGSYRDQLLQQEERRMVRLRRRCRVIDEVTRRLGLEIMREMDRYTGPDDRTAAGLVPLQRFARIVVGSEVAHAEEMAPPLPHPLRTEHGALAEAARAANSAWHSPWYRNPGFYAWVFGEGDAEGDMVKMQMDAPGFRSVGVVLPKRVFGRMQHVYATSAVTFAPAGELLSGTYINYVLPQIAVDAAYNLTDPATARHDLESRYAWRLDQYQVMGIA